eukprot:365025-Chlamydomonas_euryale.AAC.1
MQAPAFHPDRAPRPQQQARERRSAAPRPPRPRTLPLGLGSSVRTTMPVAPNTRRSTGTSDPLETGPGQQMVTFTPRSMTSVAREEK